MLVPVGAMGCGRSKHQSPKLAGQDVEIYVSASGENNVPSAAKKKKTKDEKKENKVPGSTSPKPSKSSPIKLAAGLLKPPPPPSHTNGSSSSPKMLHIDVGYPKEKTEKASPTKKQTREFSGKQANIKVTSSQIEFFKMLDEKIEQGGEYKSQDSINLLTP